MTQKKGIILIILILISIFTIGCIDYKNKIEDITNSIPLPTTKSQEYNYVSIEDIIKNQDEYIGKNVTVKGQLLVGFGWAAGEGIQWYLSDEQGFEIYIVQPLPYEDSRHYSYLDYYEIKGEITIREINPIPYYNEEENKIGYKIETVISIIPFEMRKI